MIAKKILIFPKTHHAVLCLCFRPQVILVVTCCLLLALGLLTGCDEQKHGNHQNQSISPWEKGSRDTTIKAVYDSLVYCCNQDDSIGLDMWLRVACTPQRTEEGWKGCCAAGQGMAALLQDDFQAASTAFALAAGHFDSAGIWQLQGRSLDNLARAYQNLNLTNESRNAKREAIRLFTNHGASKADSIRLVHMLSDQMHIEIQTDQYSQALQYAQQGLNLAELMRDTENCIFLLEDIANIQDKFGEQDMAKANRQQVLELLTYSSKKNPLSIIDIKMALASTPEEAEEQLEAYHQFAHQEGFSTAKQADFWYFYANKMDKLGQSDSAYIYYQKTVAAQKDEDALDFPHLWSRIKISLYLLKKGQYKAVLEHVPYTLNLARITQDGQMQLSLLDQYSQALAHTGQKDSAYHYLREMATLQDSIKKNSNEKDFMRIHMSQLFEKEKEILALQQARERQVSEAQIARQQLLLWVGSLVLLLLGALAFAFYRNFRLKQRAADALAAANARLEAEQRQLQRANAQLRRFSGVITHDILSNLDYVLASGNRLNTYDPPKEALKEYFSTSRDTCMQLKNYCVGLLHEVQQQAQTLAPDVTNPMAAIQNTIARFDAALKAAGFTVNVDHLSPSLLSPMLVEHLFQNLISNAVRYAGTAPAPQLRITEEGSAPGQYRWIVEDNGPGISAEQKHTIFEPKQNTNDGVGQHVGLGLLRANLRTYGADIWVEDRDGGGTRWVVQLPAPPKNTL